MEKAKITKVFYISMVLVLITVLLGAIWPAHFEKVTGHINNLISKEFGWYYVIISTVMVIFCVFLILSPIGKLKLGKPSISLEVQPGFMVCDAIQCRHGYRTGLLRSCRTTQSLLDATYCRKRYRSGVQRFSQNDVLPLGLPCVGHLWGCCTWTCLFSVPKRRAGTYITDATSYFRTTC